MVFLLSLAQILNDSCCVSYNPEVTMHSLTGVPRRPVVLIILDGFGVNPSRLNNGVAEASTPNLDAYFSRYPHTTVNAAGEAVGLPDG